MTTSRRRRPNSSPAAALEDDDLLAEILLHPPSRAPPSPAGAGATSSATPDSSAASAPTTTPAELPPSSVSSQRDTAVYPSSLPWIPLTASRPSASACRSQAARTTAGSSAAGDGLALLVNVHPGQVLVWDPVTGDQRRLPLPQAFRNMNKIYNGMVLRSAAAGDGDHFRFEVVLVRCMKVPDGRAIACVYSSDTGAWGDIIQTSTPLLRTLSMVKSGALVGRSLYWSLYGKSTAILEFDLDTQNLDVIPLHLDGWVSPGKRRKYGWIMPAEGGGLGLVSVLGHRAELWKMETDSYGLATWLLTKTIHLDKLLPLSTGDRLTVDFAEEHNMLVLGTIDGIGIFTVHIETMQCKKLPVNFQKLPGVFQPFSSVYTAEMVVGAEHAGAELLRNR